MKWTKRMSKEEKLQNMQEAEKKRKRLHPTRSELFGRTDEYCKLHKLSSVASKRLFNYVHNNEQKTDPRDQRQLPKTERVPRSLEPEWTYSVGYWDVSI